MHPVIFRSRQHSWALSMILVMMLALLPACTTFIPSANNVAHVQPLLLQMAQEQPDEMVRIVVQELHSHSNATVLVQEYGGRVLRDLRIINAFVAEIPARMVPRLGRSDQVRWISLDAEVIETSQNSEHESNIRDEFLTASYSGSAGSMAWLSPWSEIGEQDGAEAGDVAITRFMAGTKQGLRIQGLSKGAQRSLDLAQADAAELTFTYRRKAFGESDYVAVEASADGANWAEVGRIAGPATDEALQTASYDISALASSDTTVRFVNSTTMADGAKLYIDNVDISYTRRLLPPSVFLPLLSSDSAAIADSDRVWAADTNSGNVTVRDEFNQVSYDNNDGTVNWASAWVETNDEGTPTSGNMQIVNNELRIRNNLSGILRKVDLTNATTTTLTFDYRRDGLENSNDYVALEIAAYGDPSWTELARFAGPDNDTSLQPATFDISNFISSDTLIRFIASDKLAAGEGLYVDNVEISHDGSPNIVEPISGGVTYTATVDRDTYLSENQPNTSYGTNSAVDVKHSGIGHNRRGLFHYNIPSELAGCSVAAAKAYFYDVDSANFARMSVHRLTSDWSESSATWNSAPTYILGPDITFTTPQSEQSYSIDVTSLVQDWLYGAPNHGLMLMAISESPANDSFSSREGPDSQDPYLEIDAVCGAPIFTGADDLHNQGITGNGVTVAVVDSGIAVHNDFLDSVGTSRVITQVQFNNTGILDDYYGHGTHVAGAIGGSGSKSGGAYIGVAPQVDLLDIKVADDYGAATTSDVVAGLEWILNNKDLYNIRVVNVSLNSSVAETYHQSPLNAALEILWFNGIVVVVSAGNNGSSSSGVLFPPANDPFFITVGAADDKGTPAVSDNTVASFSAYGTTLSGFNKPDLIAPGVDIISALAGDDCNLVIAHPAHAVSGPSGSYYFRMSGTSMASSVVAGAVALLLQDEPTLTPDQVKHRLTTTANSNWPGYDVTKAGAGLLDIEAAVNATSTDSANTGIEASQLLWTGSDPLTWGSVNWGSVNWGSVNWGSVNWGSVNWGSVNWGSVNWGSVNWDD